MLGIDTVMTMRNEGKPEASSDVMDINIECHSMYALESKNIELIVSIKHIVYTR